MKRPEISIILPFYNAATTLAHAIESIVAQSFMDFECILVDNNSIDESRDIAMAFCENDPRLNLIHESKQGVTHAHNAGMVISKGKYIARMDADDLMFPDRLEKQYNFLEDHPGIYVLAGHAEYIPHSPETEGFQRYVNWSNSIMTHQDILLKQFMESPIINPTVMWRREISDKYGSYRNGEFPEDYELWLRWLSQGVKFHKLSSPLIKWHDSAQRLTRTDNRYSDQAFFEIKTKYLAQWLKIHNPHYANVVVWGASKISRNRAIILESHGIEIQNYIDISQKRQLDKSVIYYKDIPEPGKIFILVYLKEEKMRSKTVKYLNERTYKEGVDFLLVS